MHFWCKCCRNTDVETLLCGWKVWVKDSAHKQFPSATVFHNDWLEANKICAKTYDHKIKQNLETQRFMFRMLESLWNLAPIWAAQLSRHLLSFIAIWSLRCSTWKLNLQRYNKTSYWMLKWHPDFFVYAPDLLLYFCCSRPMNIVFKFCEIISYSCIILCPIIIWGMPVNSYTCICVNRKIWFHLIFSIIACIEIITRV